jgi:signal transduction histidine kinase
LPSSIPLDLTHAVSVSVLGTAGIGVAAVMLLAITVLTCMVDQRRQAQDELQVSFELLRALAGRLQTVREEERARVAREIHDQLGQSLTGIKMDVSSLIRALPADQPYQLERGEALVRLVDETIHSVRKIATDLRPGILDDLGLVAALEWAAEEFQTRTGIACHVTLPDADLPMDTERATALFRIFQETLTNITRHAAATEVSGRLADEQGILVLDVHDNGIGFDDELLARRRSLGILGMRERALLLGGTLFIRSARGRGTTVSVRIPGGQVAL